MTRQSAIVGFGVVLAVVRVWMAVAIQPSPFGWDQAYKDVAHLFVGFLFGGWLVDLQPWKWKLFWFLIFVEIIAAVSSRL
jgi:hypothetical protein